MPVSPANEVATRFEAVRDLIAGTTAFQTWCGAANAAAANAHITYMEDAPGVFTACHCILDLTGYDARAVARGTHPTTTRFRATILVDANTSNAKADEVMTFLNNLGALIAEIRNTQSLLTYVMGDIGIEEMPEYVDFYEEESVTDPHLRAALYMEFGIS